MFRNHQGVVRSGWKIALLYILFLGLTFITGVAIVIIEYTTRFKNLDTLLELAQELCEIGAVCILVYAVEKSRLTFYGFPVNRKFLKEVFYGIAWGAVSMIIVFIVFRIAGFASLKHPLSQPHLSCDLIGMLVIIILVGFGEEMLTRGYTLTLLQRQIGNKWVSIVVSSLIFAALHLANPHVSLLGFLNLILFAVVASFMYIRSGSLWLPIAYHATWDYFEGNVFGFPNSGQVLPSLYSFSHVTPNIVTGGGFGPEGGLVVTALLLLAFVWTLKIYRPSEESDWAADIFKEGLVKRAKYQ